MLDELKTLNVEIIAEEAEQKNVVSILANKKAMFSDWTVERIEDEAINSPNLYWLEPQTSFSVENELECQMDLPIITKAFQFRCFDNIHKVLMVNKTINMRLFNFYVKNSKPQYKSWGLNKIVGLKVGNQSVLMGSQTLISKLFVVIIMKLMSLLWKIF